MTAAYQCRLVRQTRHARNLRDLDKIVRAAIDIDLEETIRAARGDLHEAGNRFCQRIVLFENIGKIDLVALAFRETDDDVDIVEGGIRREHNRIGPGASGERVEPVPAKQQIVVIAAIQRVIADAAMKLIVAVSTIDGVRA